MALRAKSARRRGPLIARSNKQSDLLGDLQSQLVRARNRIPDFQRTLNFTLRLFPLQHGSCETIMEKLRLVHHQLV